MRKKQQPKHLCRPKPKKVIVQDRIIESIAQPECASCHNWMGGADDFNLCEAIKPTEDIRVAGVTYLQTHATFGCNKYVKRTGRRRI